MRCGRGAESSTRLLSDSREGKLMNVDYYSLLAKAVAGKDEAARDKIYNDASNLIRRSSQLTREAAASHAAALEDAIRRIEDELAAEDARSAAEISATLSTDRKWRPLVITASVVAVLVALSALLYSHVTRAPVGAGMTASSARMARGREEAVM